MINPRILCHGNKEYIQTIHFMAGGAKYTGSCNHRWPVAVTKYNLKETENLRLIITHIRYNDRHNML